MNIGEHEEHVKLVLQKVREKGLYAKAKNAHSTNLKLSFFYMLYVAKVF